MAFSKAALAILNDPKKKQLLQSGDVFRTSQQGGNTTYALTSPQGQPVSRPAVQGANTQYVQSASNPLPNLNQDQGQSYSMPDYDSMRREEEARVNSEVDSAYSDAFGYQDQVEKMYRENYPLYVQNINQSFDAEVPTIEAEKARREGEVASMRTKANDQTRSNIGKARNLYNQLKQGSLVRFGGSSSTADATQELLGRGFQEDVAGYNQQNFDAMRLIDKEEVNAKNFYISQISDLQRRKAEAEAALRKDFEDKIAKINQNKSELVSSKNARKLDALRDLNKEYRKLTADYSNFQTVLQQWSSAKDKAIQEARAYNLSSVEIPSVKLGDTSLGGIRYGFRNSSDSGSSQEQNLLDIKGIAAKYGLPEDEFLQRYDVKTSYNPKGQPSYTIEEKKKEQKDQSATYDPKTGKFVFN